MTTKIRITTNIRTLLLMSIEIMGSLAHKSVEKRDEGHASTNSLISTLIGDIDYLEDIEDDEVHDLIMNDTTALCVLASVKGVITSSLFDREALFKEACSVMEEDYNKVNMEAFIEKMASVNMALYDIIESALEGDVMEQWNKSKVRMGCKVLYDIDDKCTKGNDNGNERI